MNEGLRRRKTGSHELNADSSRSHAILSLYFARDGRLGKASFVDLAGSERLKDSRAKG